VSPLKLYRPRRARDEMPFLEHLEELRWRIIWSLVAVLVGGVVGFVLVRRFDVLGLLIRPLEPYLAGGRLKYLGLTDPFLLTLKLALVVGLLLASPVVIYQIWAFVAPALLPHEKRAIVPAFSLGLVLFAAGCALAYFVALPATIRFMLGFQVESLEPALVAGTYLGFVVKLLLIFGLVFELPVVVLVLAWLGVVDARTLAAKRRYAIVGTTILAAVLTPGDLVLLTAFLMVPLLLLYELSVGLARLVERRRARSAAAETLAGAS